jgi:hypothetical protein
MKRFLQAALCAATATFAGSFETWNGADGVYKVETGLGNETGTYGIWYDFDDRAYSGISAIRYEINACYDFDSDCIKHFFDPIIDYCDGICGTAVLDKETVTTTPFVGVGFNVVGETSNTNTIPAAGDASAWGGLCVTYTSDTDLALELGLGEAIDSTINYANPTVKLPASKTGNKVVVSWSDFKQPSSYNGSVKFDGETAAKQLVGVHFKIQADPGEYEFRICAVGPKDGTCPEKCGIPSPPDAIKIVRGTSAVKINLNGRALEFTGNKSAVTVEVMNSIGQVVMKGVINNTTSNAATFNLATLNAGIYMVRVSGKKVNFVKKIVLR